MFKLSHLIVFIYFSVNILAQSSPHGNKLSIKCEVCHFIKENGKYELKKDLFKHEITNFLLEGKHKYINCNKCHTNFNFSSVKKECISCHTDVHQNSSGNDCKLCHNQENWKEISFDHSSTTFPLVGQHEKVNCKDCHKEVFRGTASDCNSCHSSDYTNATDPNHTEFKLSKECQVCHTTINWGNTTFDHTKYTGFILTGRHVGLNCKKCHENGFNQTEKACISCHLSAYSKANDPEHVNAKFSKSCETCHTTSTWRPSTFDHNLNTNFPLNGIHSKTDCLKCHINNFPGTGTTCVSCHLKDYQRVKNPDHVKANFSKDCQNCHTTSGRSPTKFNHNTYTKFQIRGKHIGIECKTCHTNGYRGRSTDCVSCHLKDYESAVFPKHAESNFSKNCQNCHNEKSWKPSTINHNVDTPFPLMAGHSKLDCKKCHSTIFEGKSMDCVRCHLSDYNSAKKPIHAATKFPTACEKCHTVNKWKTSNFNHDLQHFPIFSGKHKGLWKTCTECHSNLSNFPNISCLNCHEHGDKLKMDTIHVNVKDYFYSGKSCYICHKNGRK